MYYVMVRVGGEDVKMVFVVDASEVRTTEIPWHMYVNKQLRDLNAKLQVQVITFKLRCGTGLFQLE